MKRIFYFLIGLMLLMPLGVSAQRVAKVTDFVYTYIAPDNMGVVEAKEVALKRAQIEAIAAEFGTIVSQTETLYMQNGDQSKTDYFSLGEAQVKGEWIGTDGKPKYDVDFTDEGHLMVKVTVSGRIRELVRTGADIIVKVLRCVPEERFEGYDFKHNDDVFLYFKSPISGYVTVYFVDKKADEVYCLLPYQNSDDKAFKVKGDKSYVFFSEEKALEEHKHLVDPLVMQCAGDVERNDVYVVFSPNSYVKANADRDESHPLNMLSWNDFNKWLGKLRNRDKDVQVVTKTLKITPKD